ncbi:MAG: hypothetical protein LBC85_02255 [Fibromonadaceae bacterium]|jgi:hypothetical protein|nr:hypothetical protein [Fibromonadaceae bacterium]
MAHGEDISNSNAEPEELLGFFSIIGDSEKTPFILQITFENCRELKDLYGNTLPLTNLQLKYKNAQNSWVTMDLRIPARGQNCFNNINFFIDVQERYDMELWASWDRQKAAAGTFFGNASFKILPRY